MNSDPAFSRSGLAFYRKWMGLFDETRENLLQRYPTHDAAIEAMEYGDFSKRRDALRVLGALGDFEAVTHYALMERESGWIPKLASLILVSPSLEVLVSWTSKLKRSGDGGYLGGFVAFDLPWINHSHIGDELVAYFVKEKRRLARLQSHHYEALGLSALKPAARLLSPEIEVDSLRTFQQALDAGEPRKKCRPSDSDSLGCEDRELDLKSSNAIAALCALRRLGEAVDPARVVAWIEQLEHLLAKYEYNYEYWDLTGALRWVLFDLGDESQLEKFTNPYPKTWGCDVAMTMMRRGDIARLAPWLDAMTERAARSKLSVFPLGTVHFWPLIDYLQSRGHVLGPIADSGYLMARATGIAAPDDWTWKCTPSED